MLALKLFLVPSLIAAISLAARRWGPAVAGWLSGFPVVSAPVLLILGLEQGSAFAAQAAAATLSAVSAVLVFSVTYARLAVRASPAVSLAGALAAYAAAVSLLQLVSLPVPVWAALLYVAITLAPRAFPEVALTTSSPVLGRGAIALRMSAAAALVLAVTTFAAHLGAKWSGVFAMFPVVGIVMAVSSHRHAGAAFTVRLLRGMVLGFYAFTTFCVLLASAIGPLSLAAAFGFALAAAALVQAALIRVVRSRPLAAATPPQPPTAGSTAPARAARSSR
jgi:hypothetical protein